MSPTLKKEIKSWVIILSVMLVGHFTGINKHFITGIQSVMIQVMPLNLSPDHEKVAQKADYSLTMSNPAGELIKFEDYKGKVVFLNLWASWCPPCLAEMPNINNLYEKMKDEPDIKFVMLSIDENFDKAQAYVNRKKFNFPYFKVEFMPQVFKSPSIPTTYVINKSGEIIFIKEGMADYNTNKFIDLLKEAANEGN
ncbi:TlpA family protein disulfide reductase [Penaeicola halotolerans]|uniref:TlpA family protein disulfide reductase n=1 Tax=Penaeicola halotolerans TaxID=2793196 RepID=UPI001CF8D2AF|nr:TlpA disulfide reductase family protein [Penaeicola halotolerans]